MPPQASVPPQLSAVEPGVYDVIIILVAPADRPARRILGLRLGLCGRRQHLVCDQRGMHPTLGCDHAHLLHPQPTAAEFELQDAVAPGKTADHLRFRAGPGTQVSDGAFDHVDLPGSRVNSARGPGNQRQRQRRRRQPLEDRKTTSRHRRPNAPFDPLISVGPILTSPRVSG